MARELSDAAAYYQAQAWESYHARGGRLGLSAWMDSKDLGTEDRVAILCALEDVAEEPA